MFSDSVDLVSPDNVFFITDRTSPIFTGKHGKVCKFPCSNVQKNKHNKIPCLTMPLTALCHHFNMSCGEPESKFDFPIVLPSISGNLAFKGSEEPMYSMCKIFELVHINIHKLTFVKKIRGNGTRNLEQQIINIKKELTMEVLQNNQHNDAYISWLSLCLEVDIRRDITKTIKDKIDCIAANLTSFECRRLELFHENQAGASTLARRVLYDLRRKFICLVLLMKDSTTDVIFSHLSDLYHKCRCAILLLIDNCSECANRLITKFEDEPIPIILFQVTAGDSPDLDKSLVLSHQLSKEESRLFKAKYGNFLKENNNFKKSGNIFLIKELSTWNNQELFINLVSLLF